MTTDVSKPATARPWYRPYPSTYVVLLLVAVALVLIIVPGEGFTSCEASANPVVFDVFERTNMAGRGYSSSG